MATEKSRPTATKQRAITAPEQEPAQLSPAAADKNPFLSASLGLPGPGADVHVGPVNLTLPTGYLYYGGLGALAVAGTLEWPVAVALGAGGLLVDRFRKTRTSQPVKSAQ
ncbi:hypothetical protein DFR70_1222 [Nocardia tenerifensis]|uniref:Uncharacterized protein n=2 Tax=Nocardia tenerifensis TaxID=228006 RepID=A0A318JPS1_9NOCA|nr:hypothetical protein [Nocardia tenerifensis]PXX54861.1 hypothetical protein DFR70_1222 [Nocardia tenerifensis]